MICDQTTIELIAGKGGDGLVHFRREKYVPYGGPDGGDGGKGGNVLLEANENCRTLLDLKTRKVFQAKNGQSGGPNNCFGRAGDDLVLIVPTGTVVRTHDGGSIIADLKKNGDLAVVAQGGIGGKGNKHFASSRYQVPRFAEWGEPGQRSAIFLELRLIGDVGIIGLPSVGKSTLLNTISNTHVKTAVYHFTTLEPNLGVVDLSKWIREKSASFVIADIPGLIEGAHRGKGLGHKFLRHVMRTDVLLHMIDIDEKDLKSAEKVILQELKHFDKELLKKPRLIVFNKIDLYTPEDREILVKLVRGQSKKKMYFVSAATGEGIKELLLDVWKLVKESRKFRHEEESRLKRDEHVVFRPHLENQKIFLIRREKNHKQQRVYRIIGKRIEQVAVMTDLSNPEGLLHLRHVMKSMGLQRGVVAEGARNGDLLRIGEKEFEFRGVE